MTQEEKRMTDAIHEVASSEAGRLVLGAILKESCLMHEDLFHAESPNTVSYGLGRRAVGEEIRKLLGLAGRYCFADCEAAYENHIEALRSEREAGKRKKEREDEEGE